MQANGPETFPQRGWPQEIHNYLLREDEVSIVDLGKNGRSTKSYIDEGRFKEALSKASKGDIAFISFGHNDEKKEDPTRYTDPFGTYQSNLETMAKAFLKKGAKVIFLSSIERLHVDSKGNIENSHGDYPKAMKEKAEQLGLPYIDLNALTHSYLESHSYAVNSGFYMIFGKGEYPSKPEGSDDHTHLTQTGANWICQLVVPELKKIDTLARVFR